MPEYSEVFENDTAHVQCEGGPLRVQLGPSRFREGGVEVPEEEWRMLIDRVAWRENPPFSEGGRSALAVRKEPLDVDGEQIRGYKLKGIGVFDPRTGVATPPRDEKYQRHFMLDLNQRDPDVRDKLLSVLPQILVHMGVDENGNFYPVPDPSKPKGGLIHGRGRREFENAAALREGGVSACLPVLWGRYPELEWQGQPMQWVILGLSNVDPRSSACFEPSQDHRGFGYGDYMREVVSRQFEMFDPERLTGPALGVTEALGGAVGTALRQAHEKAGVARFAGHTGNFTYVPESRSVIMHDFDSSVKVDSLAPKARALSLVRDIESAMFGLLHSLAHSRLFYIADKEKLFRRKNPLGQILKAYFPDTDVSAEMKAIEDLTVWAIKEYGYNKPYHKQAEWQTVAGERVTNELMMIVSRAYRKSEMNDLYEIPVSDRELSNNLAGYNVQRQMAAMKMMRETASTLPPWARAMIGM